jgi:hypothetical protein
VDDPCEVDADCVEAAYCDFGQCAARLDIDQFCEGQSLRCRPELYCDPVRYLCVERVENGGECSEEACVAGAICGPDGRCRAAPGLGEDCSESNVCAAGGYCLYDYLQMPTCEPALEPGAPCDAGSKCASGSCSGGVCAEPFADICSGVPQP